MDLVLVRFQVVTSQGFGKVVLVKMISLKIMESKFVLFGACKAYLCSTILSLVNPERERHRHRRMVDSILHTSAFLNFSLPQHEDSIDSHHAVVILNNRLPWFTPLLWRKARLHVCADGGANRLYDDLPNLLPPDDRPTARERYKPDVIKGDMDSIRPEVKEFYARLGTTILDESYDQDTTDLHKCIAFIRDSQLVENINFKLLVVGALGGRLDHELANINVLYTFPRIRIVLVSDDSLAFLLPKNCHHEIVIDPAVEGPHCGLIPVGGPSQSTTTTGLKWNLEKNPMQFGGLISTSNLCESKTITVSSDADLLWTISIQKLCESIPNWKI